jgi:hypothetical protein
MWPEKTEVFGVIRRKGKAYDSWTGFGGKTVWHTWCYASGWNLSKGVIRKWDEQMGKDRALEDTQSGWVDGICAEKEISQTVVCAVENIKRRVKGKMISNTWQEP